MKKQYYTFIKPLAAILISSLTIAYASAGAVSSFSDTLSTAKVSTSSNHSFVFTTPTGIGSGATVIITFPSEFVIPFALSFTDVDINNGAPYAASSTLAASPAGATVGVARTSSTTLTITNGTTVISPGAAVYVRIGTNATFGVNGALQVLNATTTGNKTIGLTGSFGDTGSTTVNIITDDTVQISAVVSQTLSFTISSTSTNFGNLLTGSARFASSTNVAGDSLETVAHTLVAATNAPSGYTITIRGATLTSQQNASNTIPAIGATVASSTAGTSQFGIRATAAGGTGSTIATPYAAATSYGYNGTATTSATFASGSGSTLTTTYSLRYVANISSIQEAGTYTTGLTYIATANF